MELKVTTEHSPVTLKEIFLQDLREDSTGERENLHDHRRKLIELIEHLEENVNYAPQWVTTSLWSGGFYITESNTWFHWNARVVVGRARDHFRISYRLPPNPALPSQGHLEIDDHDKETWVVFESDDLTEVGHFIVIGLEKAERGLPKDPTEIREWQRRNRP